MEKRHFIHVALADEKVEFSNWWVHKSGHEWAVSGDETRKLYGYSSLHNVADKVNIWDSIRNKSEKDANS